jgi:hypothetical protein
MGIKGKGHIQNGYSEERKAINDKDTKEFPRKFQHAFSISYFTVC